MLAELTDVEAALGRSLTEAETPQIKTLLSEASDLIIGYLGCDPTDTSVEPCVPPVVSRVAARMVARVTQQGGVPGAQSATESVGPFSRTAQFAPGTNSGDPWLSAKDKITLRPFRCGGGMKSVSLASLHTGYYRERV